MRMRRLVLLLFGMTATAPLAATEHVILLHGLARTSRSMATMARGLERAGYTVDNRDYPSRSAPVEELALATIDAALAKPEARAATRIHFVTHSMGGILVRARLARGGIDRLGRVVMLAPPNAGSEVVDRLGGWWLFKRVGGPAGAQLGTGGEALARTLGPATFELGVIAGDRSMNWINSGLIPGSDDGKVSVASTRLEGMADHVVIHATHPFIAGRREALELTLGFLRTGAFPAIGSVDDAPTGGGTRPAAGIHRRPQSGTGRP